MNNFQTYQLCIEACLECASICNHCASSCAEDDDVKQMARCIQLDMECASVCYAAVQLMSLGSTSAPDLCRICATICKACADECIKHESLHCRECAAACNRCHEECRKLAA